MGEGIDPQACRVNLRTLARKERYPTLELAQRPLEQGGLLQPGKNRHQTKQTREKKLFEISAYYPPFDFIEIQIM